MCNGICFMRNRIRAQNLQLTFQRTIIHLGKGPVFSKYYFTYIWTIVSYSFLQFQCLSWQEISLKCRNYIDFKSVEDCIQIITLVFSLFSSWWCWSLNSRPTCLLDRHSTTWGTPQPFFWDRVSWTICPGCLQTVILLICASWVARMTGMSHQCWVRCFLFRMVHSCSQGEN
jgi:hypothetical protein